jgi:hypothetical protein
LRNSCLVYRTAWACRNSLILEFSSVVVGNETGANVSVWV